MYKGKDPRRNASGYLDPTAYEAIEKISRDEREDKRVKKLIATIYSICDLAGFSVETRIVLKDVKTGRIWR